MGGGVPPVWGVRCRRTKKKTIKTKSRNGEPACRMAPLWVTSTHYRFTQFYGTGCALASNDSKGRGKKLKAEDRTDVAG